MAGTDLRRGAHMRRGGAVWAVKLLKDGVIHLVRDDTGEVDRLTVRQWQAECSEGATEMAAAPDAALTEKEKALRQVALADLPGNVRASALKKEFYVRAFMEPLAFYETHHPGLPEADRPRPTRTKRLLVPFARLVDEAFRRRHGFELVQLFEREGATARRRPEEERDAHPVPAHFLRPPSFSTYCAWIGRWEDIALRNGRPDARLMASRFHERGPDARTMAPEVHEWLEELIDKVWLTGAKNGKVTVHNLLKARVLKHNGANPERPLAAPGQRHVSRYIEQEVDRETAVRRRSGDKEAELEFRPVGEGPREKHILEVVEVDHTRANVDVCDDETGIKLGRPWVTTALDRRSRLPVGVHVHFDGPSFAAVTRVLRDVMLPKDYVREMLPELDYDYPGLGRPVAFFFDRGADFDNDQIREIANEFDIEVDYEPVGCPQYKGRLERWHRTMAEQVTHPLPGATPPRDKDGVRRDPDGKAYITFSAYYRRLWRWIATVYARAPHRTLRSTPLLAWEEGAKLRLPRPLPSRESMQVLLNRTELLTASKTGVQWKHLRWNGDALRRIRAYPSHRKGDRLKVRIDDSDLGKAWVVDPVTRAPEKLDPVFKEYMPGKTSYQHRMVTLWAEENLEGARDEQAYLQAFEALNLEADELLAGKAGARKGGRSMPAVPRYRNRQPQGAPVAAAAPGQVADPEPQPHGDGSKAEAERPDASDEEVFAMEDIRKDTGKGGRRRAVPEGEP